MPKPDETTMNYDSDKTPEPINPTPLQLIRMATSLFVRDLKKSFHEKTQKLKTMFTMSKKVENKVAVISSVPTLQISKTILK
jgi:hypothetical protein